MLQEEIDKYRLPDEASLREDIGPGVYEWIHTIISLGALGIFGWPVLVCAGLPDIAMAVAVIGVCSFIFFLFGPKPRSMVEESERNKRAEQNALIEHQKQEARIVCPHCQTKGFVTTKKVNVRKGIHGGKATAALLTGGVSMIGTGLSQHDEMTQANCSNCGSTWRF